MRKCPRDPETVECLAVFIGHQLYLNLGIHHLAIEFDCQILVKRLQSKEVSTSFARNITQDLKDMMTRFHVCFVNSGYCQNNIVVHELARFTCNIENIILWYELKSKI